MVITLFFHSHFCFLHTCPNETTATFLCLCIFTSLVNFILCTYIVYIYIYGTIQLVPDLSSVQCLSQFIKNMKCLHFASPIFFFKPSYYYPCYYYLQITYVPRYFEIFIPIEKPIHIYVKQQKNWTVFNSVRKHLSVFF